MSGFLQKVVDAWRQRGAEPPTTSFVPKASSARHEQTSKEQVPPVDVPKPPEPYPGNFYGFPFFIRLRMGERVLDGYPKVPIRDTTTGETKWGSRMEWSFPGPDKMQVDWVDDPERGLNKRTIEHPEDALGSEGRLGDDMQVRFERILTIGKNQVVYALYCPAKGIRLAYGFDRKAFEPGYQPVEAEL
jgi:hypothetical protein